MKNLSLFIFLLLCTAQSFAQSNFYKLSVGGGAGGAITFADLHKKKLTLAGYATADYYFTPYVAVGLEAQKGELAGGDIHLDKNNQRFINKYLAGSVNLKVSFGEFISSHKRRIPFFNALSGVYGGVGLGVISNKVSNVRYYGENYFPGEYKSKEEIVPVNLGINIPLVNSWGYHNLTINVNFQTTFALGEGMDGYTPIAGRNDFYTFLSGGLKYHFGYMRVDRRR